MHILSVFVRNFSIPLIILILFNVILLFDAKQKGSLEYKEIRKMFLYWLCLTAALLFYDIMHP